MQASRDLFAGVLDAVTEQSIIATDADGLITVFNAGAERMLGYSASEMIGTTPDRLHDGEEIRHRAAELGLPPDVRVFLAGPATGKPETRFRPHKRRAAARRRHYRRPGPRPHRFVAKRLTHTGRGRKSPATGSRAKG